MEITLVDMGHGAVGLTLTAAAAQRLRFAPGTVVKVCVESQGI